MSKDFDDGDYNGRSNQYLSIIVFTYRPREKRALFIVVMMAYHVRVILAIIIIIFEWVDESIFSPPQPLKNVQGAWQISDWLTMCQNYTHFNKLKDYLEFRKEKKGINAHLFREKISLLLLLCKKNKYANDFLQTYC